MATDTWMTIGSRAPLRRAAPHMRANTKGMSLLATAIPRRRAECQVLSSTSDVRSLLIECVEDGAIAQWATAMAAPRKGGKRVFHGLQAPDLVFNIGDLCSCPAMHVPCVSPRACSQ